MASKNLETVEDVHALLQEMHDNLQQLSGEEGQCLSNNARDHITYLGYHLTQLSTMIAEISSLADSRDLSELLHTVGFEWRGHFTALEGYSMLLLKNAFGPLTDQQKSILEKFQQKTVAIRVWSEGFIVRRTGS